MLQRHRVGHVLEDDIDLKSLEDYARRFTVWAHCENTDCLHREQLDFADLIERLGADFPMADLNAKLTCTKCAGKDTSVTLTTQ